MLYDIEDEWNDILSASTYIDVFRRDALVVALKFRVNALEKIAALHIKERKAKNHEQSR
jgi:hypothetical protein